MLIDQYRHALGETRYEIPAGVSEASDASMLAAAQRELAEETGYGGGEWRLLMTVAPNPATQNNCTWQRAAKCSPCCAAGRSARR